jgi:hypothetical protein
MGASRPFGKERCNAFASHPMALASRTARMVDTGRELVAHFGNIGMSAFELLSRFSGLS